MKKYFDSFWNHDEMLSSSLSDLTLFFFFFLNSLTFTEHFLPQDPVSSDMWWDGTQVNRSSFLDSIASRKQS